MTAILKDNISELLTNDEYLDEPHTDSITPTEYILSQAGKAIEVTFNTGLDQSDEYRRAVLTSVLTFSPKDKKDLIHISWIKSLDGVAIKSKPTVKGKYVDIHTKYFFDKDTAAVVLKEDVKVCTSCASVLDTSHSTLCKKCLTSKYYNVLSYSHKPVPKFTGKPVNAKEEANPIFYGLELEYGLSDNVEISLLVEYANGGLYLKSDSSVRGGSHQVEMVSHPYTFQELMSPTSWTAKLPSDAVHSPNSNGCHIHISRTAFQSDKHYAKFKHLLLSNQSVLEAVGGRKLNNYCQINAGAKHVVLSTKDKVGGEKYFLVNEAHKDTIELRFMASTNSTEQLHRYLQFIHSMIKYTSYNINTASYEGFTKYVKKYSSTYPILAKFVEANVDMFKDGTVSYSQRKIIETDFYNLAAKDYYKIISITICTPNGSPANYVGVTDVSRFTVEINTGTGKLKSIMGYNVNDNNTVTVKYIKG